MDIIRPVPRGMVLFYLVNITTAFSFLENITEPTSYQDRSFSCNDTEYFVSNRCCQKCPAGTRVSISCSVNHGLGDCRICTTGKDFTAFPNGLKTCLPCQACREDEVLVAECTLARNTLCECKQGTYLCQANMNCSNTGTCSTCSSCPEGQGIIHPCNATANTVCGDLVGTYIQNLTQKALIISLTVLSVIIIIICICFIIYRYCHSRKKGEGQDHPVEVQTASTNHFPDNVSNVTFPDSEQQCMGSNAPLIDAEMLPDSEDHGFLPYISLRDTKEDPHYGSTMSISNDLENHKNHISGLQNSINGHASLTR